MKRCYFGYRFKRNSSLYCPYHTCCYCCTTLECCMYRGDIVVLEKANLLGFQEFNPAEVEVGDIVVYNAAWHDGPVIHRVIEKGQINSTTVYKIKGDNNDVADPYWVTEGQITSRVLTFNGQPLIIPKIGYISIWIRGL